MQLLGMAGMLHMSFGAHVSRGYGLECPVLSVVLSEILLPLVERTKFVHGMVHRITFLGGHIHVRCTSITWLECIASDLHGENSLCEVAQTGVLLAIPLALHDQPLHR